MWIRSQNKEVLIKCKNIQIDEVKEDFFRIGERLGKHATLLGCYLTKERALEVLGEIQDKIQDRIHEIERNPYFPQDQFVNPIYQMPEK